MSIATPHELQVHPQDLKFQRVYRLVKTVNDIFPNDEGKQRFIYNNYHPNTLAYEEDTNCMARPLGSEFMVLGAPTTLIQAFWPYRKRWYVKVISTTVELIGYMELCEGDRFKEVKCEDD